MTAIATCLLIAVGTLGGLLATSTAKLNSVKSLAVQNTNISSTILPHNITLTSTQSTTATQNFTMTSITTLPPVYVTSVVTEQVTVMVTRNKNVTVDVTCSNRGWSTKYEILCNAEERQCLRISRTKGKDGEVGTVLVPEPTKV
jgi:hypothetical protein